jgi:hypothetical protein
MIFTTFPKKYLLLLSCKYQASPPTSKSRDKGERERERERERESWAGLVYRFLVRFLLEFSHKLIFLNKLPVGYDTFFKVVLGIKKKFNLLKPIQTNL